MRFVEGTDLREVLRHGALEPARAAMLGAQVSEALDAAHRRGLVHRDVKPSNVLIARQAGHEHCYLADFGLTQSATEAGPVDGGMLGTIDYVAPEAIRGDPVDGRADQYALGCMLFECLHLAAPQGTITLGPGSAGGGAELPHPRRGGTPRRGIVSRLYASRRASTARCFGPPSGSGTPLRRTSSGPSRRNSSCGSEFRAQ